MKIVMLCEFYDEALEFQENLLAKYYAKHGHDVVIITSTFKSVFDYYNDRHDNTVPASTVQRGRVKIVRLRFAFNIMNRLRRYTDIKGILEEERPGLIFIHDIMPNMLEAVAYRRRHPECRMIMDYHADYSNSGKNWLSIRLLHGVLRKSYLDRTRPHLDRIFPIVPAGAVFLHEVYKVPHSEMEVLPLGADTDLGGAVRERGEGRRIRERLGIKDGELAVFTGGKLDPKKKTELLIEAVLRIADPGVHLLIAGEAGPANAAYKERLLTLAAGSARIHFLGWLGAADVYAHMSACDLAAFPASQSILWQQCISMRLPLIVGNTGHQDVTYLNGHGNIIMLAADRIDADALEECVRSLAGDRGLRKSMADGAARVTDELLDWNKLIARTLPVGEVSATAPRSGEPAAVAAGKYQ